MIDEELAAPVLLLRSEIEWDASEDIRAHRKPYAGCDPHNI